MAEDGLPDDMKQVRIQPAYLGDGVYAAFDGYQIWVRTQSCPSGIALEPPVLQELDRFRERIRIAFAAERKVEDHG